MTADGTYRSARAGEAITTAAELDGLPVESVLRLNAGLVASLLGDGWVIGGYYGYQEIRESDLPAEVLFRPDAPQPATTDDTVERAARALVVADVAVNGLSADWKSLGEPQRESWRFMARAALAAAGTGSEPRATLLRLADEMQRAEWPGTGEEARAVVETIADTLRDEAARPGAGKAWCEHYGPGATCPVCSGAGAEVDREALDVEPIRARSDEYMRRARNDGAWTIPDFQDDRMSLLAEVDRLRAARSGGATPGVTDREARDMWNRPYPAFVQRLAALGIEVTP